MCGICGYITPGGLAAEQASARVTAMTERLRHRGPDASGRWIDTHWGVALGFRRLAIVETSPAGNQPMISRSGRYVMVLNGEIYNHAEMRPELAADLPAGCGRSDSGVLLASVERWGLAEALNRCIGTFSVALWDRTRQTLLLARDRIGEKPLFYGLLGSGAAATLLFGSELKALWAHPHWQGDLDRESLAAYCQLRYVPAPRSIFADIHKLLPGHWIAISHRALQRGDALPAPTPYWGARACRFERSRQPMADVPEALEALDTALGRSVGRQMLADVPVGMWLSGGIDSSAVTAIMQEQSRRPVRTFTVGFHEPELDEATHARKIARHLGTEHTELYVGAADALAVIPELATIWDEPLADTSQVPTLLLSRLARQQVKVALTGDGGDELFCGYRRHLQGARLWRGLGRLPPGLRGRLAKTLRHTPRGLLHGSIGWLGCAGGARPLADQIKDNALALGARDLAEFHHRLRCDWQPEDNLVRGATAVMPELEHGLESLEVREAMMFMDVRSWLVDDVLAKVDRASMSASLECRAPLLDHELIETAWSLPPGLKTREGCGKWALRQLLYRRVPPSIVNRPKQGFNIPTAAWLRGPLREWAQDLFRWRQIDADGVLDTAWIRPLWQQHLAGQRDAADRLWGILTFLAWDRAYRARPSAAVP